MYSFAPLFNKLRCYAIMHLKLNSVYKIVLSFKFSEYFNPMKITINHKNKKHEMEIDPSTTIYDFKVEIEKILTDIPAASMTLIHAGKILKDNEKKIVDYSLPENCTIAVNKQTTLKINPEPASQIPDQMPQEAPQSNTANNAFMREMMQNQLNHMLENPQMIDSLMGTSMEGRSESEKAMLRANFADQIKPMLEHPEMFDSLFGKFFSGDSSAMMNMMKGANNNNLFGNANMFQQPAASSVVNTAVAPSQQAFSGSYTEPSPTIPCSHQYYPYGYVGPQIYNQSVQQKISNQPIQQNINSQQAFPQQKQATMSPAELEKKYAAEIEMLEGMGFSNRANNIKALDIANGNVDMAVALILAWIEGGNK